MKKNPETVNKIQNFLSHIINKNPNDLLKLYQPITKNKGLLNIQQIYNWAIQSYINKQKKII